MAYKKYIKRGNKLFGPYIYESKREGSRVTTNYVGKAENFSAVPEKSKKYFFRLPVLVVLLIIVAFILLLHFRLSGHAVLQVDNIYSENENIKGNLKLALREGELIPLNSRLIVNLSGQQKEIPLRYALKEENLSDFESHGDFYAEGKALQGSGEGYGIVGKKTIYPEIYFKLKIISYEIQPKQPEEKPGEEIPEETEQPKQVNVSENITQPTPSEQQQEQPTIVNETVEQLVTEQPREENIMEIPEATATTEKPAETIEETQQVIEETAPEQPAAEQIREQTAEQTTTSGTENSTETAPITGQIISEENKKPGLLTKLFSLFRMTGRAIDGSTDLSQSKIINEETINAAVSKDKPFTYSLSDNQLAEIVPGSVMTGNETLSDDILNLNIVDNEAQITTDYYEFETGFGQEYLTGSTHELEINLSSLGIKAEEGRLEVSVVYGDEEIARATTDISIEKPKGPEENITTNISIPELIENLTNITLPEANITEINITETNITNITAQNISIQTIQGQAVIGEPVKWKKIIKTEIPENITIKLPAEAENITIKKFKERQEETTEIETSLINVPITGQIILRGGEENKKPGLITRFFNLFRATGQATLEIEQEKKNITEQNGEKKEGEISINLTGAKEYEIEYETRAPLASEEEISELKKQITISGPENINYENVLAFTEINESLAVKNSDSIKLYWLKENYDENGSFIGNTRQEHEFQALDTNNNGIIDYISWVVPHLSNQTFEISIVILNVQSYPVLGGNWTVMFNTTGTADLKITAMNGTTWTDYSGAEHDLKLLEIKCGNSTLNYEFINETSNCSTGTCSVFIANYSCNETGYETSKVLTPGHHTLEFEFGGTKAYAYNYATISSCTDLNTKGTEYRLTANVARSATCINITANDTILDCQGYSVSSTSGNAVLIDEAYKAGGIVTNVTIKNCKINQSGSSSSGIRIYENGNNSVITNNTINISSSSTGIEVNDGSSGSLIVNVSITFNKINSSGTGISLTSSMVGFENNISYNNITTSGSSAYSVYVSGYNKIEKNNITTLGSCIYGIYLAGCNNTITSNLIGSSVSGSYGIYSTERDNIMAYNNISFRIISYITYYGIYLLGVQNNTLRNNFINISTLNPSSGIYLRSSSNNNITSNTISVDEAAGINGQGIYLYSSSNYNTLTWNNISSFSLGGSGCGIAINQSSENNITDNNMNNTAGHGLLLANSNNNRILRAVINTSTGNALMVNHGSNNVTLTDSLLNSTGATAEVYIADSCSNGDINLTSVNFTDKTFASPFACKLNIHWYFDAYVNYTNGTAAYQANVTGWNVTGTVRFSNLTNSSGHIRQILLEYSESDDGTVYQTNYTINATRQYATTHSKQVNLTTNKYETFTIETGPNVTICRDLEQANTIYYLQNNVKSTETCFTVKANNVTLNCLGREINYSYTSGAEGYGVYVLGYNQTTVKNCTIKEGRASTDPNYAVYYYKSSNGTVENNTIRTLGSSSHGIYLESICVNNSLINNNITSSAYGVYLYSSLDNLISSNKIITGAENRGYAIFLQMKSNNNRLLGNNITANGNFGHGVYLNSSSNSTVANNTITTNGGEAKGVYLLDNSTTNIVRNNNITTYSGEGGNGIHLDLNASYNNISLNNITTLANSYGFYLSSNSSSNIISNNTIVSLGGESGIVFSGGDTVNNTFLGMQVLVSDVAGYAIYIGSLNHTFTVSDSILNCSNPSYKELYIYSYTNGGTWNFTNVTRADGISPFNKTWSAGANGTLNVHWYLDAYVNDTLGNAINQVNVTGWNVTGTMRFSNLTNSSGHIARHTLLEYWQNGSNIWFQTNYTINATKDGYANHTKFVNLTTNKFEVFTLNDSTYPLINFTAPTPGNATTTSNTSIQINVSITEYNLNNMIFNWNKTNFTIYNNSLLFMANFDNVTALGENDTFVKDLSKYGISGTAYNANISSGKYGKAFTFWGWTTPHSYINFGNNIDIATQAFTISVWIMSNKSSQNIHIVGKRAQTSGESWYRLMLLSSGYASFEVANNFPVNYRGLDDNVDLRDGNWHYISGVRDSSGTVVLYVDGKQKNSASFGTYSLSNIGNFTVGKCPTADSFGFNGTIDEVRVWNYSLSAAEINQSYMSNLYKYNLSQWYLYTNQSKAPNIRLDSGTYTYQALVTDLANNFNKTEERTITIQTNVTNCSAGCLYIRNFSAYNITLFDKFGNLDLKGSLTQQSIGTPDGNDLLFKDSAGTTIAWINDINGAMRLAGKLYNDQGSYCTPTGASFVIKNDTGGCVAYINSSGDLWLKGSIVQNAVI